LSCHAAAGARLEQNISLSGSPSSCVSCQPVAGSTAADGGGLRPVSLRGVRGAPSSTHTPAPASVDRGERGLIKRRVEGPRNDSKTWALTARRAGFLRRVCISVSHVRVPAGAIRSARMMHAGLLFACAVKRRRRETQEDRSRPLPGSQRCKRKYHHSRNLLSFASMYCGDATSKKTSAPYAIGV
jgi:hypothetical protein